MLDKALYRNFVVMMNIVNNVKVGEIYINAVAYFRFWKSTTLSDITSSLS
jgi:hypothetical protein